MARRAEAPGGWLAMAAAGLAAAGFTVANNPPAPQPLLSPASWLAWADANTGAAAWALFFLSAAVFSAVLARFSRPVAVESTPRRQSPLMLGDDAARPAAPVRAAAPDRPPNPQALRAEARRLVTEGAAAAARRDYAAARRAFESAALRLRSLLRLKPDAAVLADLGAALAGVGESALAGRDADTAQPALSEALVIANRLRDDRLRLRALRGLGDVAELRRDLRTALARYEEALPLAEAAAEAPRAGAKAVIDRTHCRRRVAELRSWLSPAA